MRSAIATLIFFAAGASSALAQTPPAAPMAPAAPPATAPAAPATPPAAAPATTPAATAPATAPAAPGTPDASAPPAAAPAAPAEAPPPEKTYVVPTEGEVGFIIRVINEVCVPWVRGGKEDQLASAALGFKKNRRDGTYVANLVAKPYTLTLYPKGSNPNVCRMAINYTTGQEKPIIVGLNIFSLLHQPELEQQRNDFVPATDFKRITNSWEYLTDKESIGLVFLQLKKPDGSEVNPKWGTGEVLYSERHF